MAHLALNLANFAASTTVFTKLFEQGCNKATAVYLFQRESATQKLSINEYRGICTIKRISPWIGIISGCGLTALLSSRLGWVKGVSVATLMCFDVVYGLVQCPDCTGKVKTN